MKPAFVLPYQTPMLTSHYTMGYELWEGPRGTTTYLCLDKTTNEPVACKSISKSSDCDLPRHYDAWREIQVMHRVSGTPGAVTLRGTYEDSQGVHLVTDICEGGNLFDWILEKGSSYTEREAARLMSAIVGFVRSCHSLGVMHRDLKPEIFLFKSDGEDLPLVVDFGCSVFFHEGDKFTEIVGNPYYAAPEVVKKGYGPEADVWSAGIILYILLYGAPPFAATNKEKLFDKILSGTLDLESKQWADISDDAKDLIRKMLEKDPKKRISTNDILCHPWMVDESKVPDKPLDSAVLLRLQQFSAMSKAQELSWSLQRFLSSQLHLEGDIMKEIDQIKLAGWMN